MTADERKDALDKLDKLQGVASSKSEIKAINMALTAIAHRLLEGGEDERREKCESAQQ